MNPLNLIMALTVHYIRETPDATFKGFITCPAIRAALSARERTHGPVDLDWLESHFDGEQLETSARSTRGGSFVVLGKDPFGEAARLDAEREERRENYREEYGHPLGSVGNPRRMGGVMTAVEPAAAVQTSRRASKPKKAA